MNGTMEFNLQSYLENMRTEINNGLGQVHKDMTQMRVDFNAHLISDVQAFDDLRNQIKSVREFRTTVTRLVWAVVTSGVIGAVALAFDIMRNHWK